MPTTFSPTFKNGTINSLTGRTSPSYPLYYVNPYSGTQTADPTVAPTAYVFTGYSAAITIGTFMSQPAYGVSALSGSHVYAAANAITVSTARIYDSSGTAMVDVAASLIGGGGGAIFANLSSSVGVNFELDQFSMKTPLSNGGTLLINTALANAISNMWCVTMANIAFGSSAAINIYSGAAPATADAPATGTLLATFTTAVTGGSWNTASAGSAALVAALTVAASATGTAGYVRIVKGTMVMQGSVGTAGTDFIINSTSLTSGVNVSLTDATISM